MDKITAEVQSFYEAYPYPPDGRVDCDGYHARLLLSYLQRNVQDSGPVRVLEAGCGRGMNLQAAAEIQSDIDFTGIDVNRVAIAEADRRSAQSGLANLRYRYADLLDRGSLPALQGGYQVILSYGVVHHLSDPLQGLSTLNQLLASQGVIAIMLDGSFGRQPLDRYLQALNIVDPGQRSMDRVPIARALATAAETSLFKGNHWQGTAVTDDIEFADRCLHVHQHSYDIAGLWRLLESAGLRFIRWLEPNDWTIRRLIDDAQLLGHMEALNEVDQYRLIERLFFRPKLTMVVSKRDENVRKPLQAAEVASAWFARSPQLTLEADDARGGVCRLRGRKVDLDGHPLSRQILAQAADWPDGFSGRQLIDRLTLQGNDSQLIIQAVLYLVEHELLFRPHPDSLEQS
ncbi:MAG: class I SAM-dependent methyltransferase [Candidatus Thiodiazotropha sp.]